MIDSGSKSFPTTYLNRSRPPSPGRSSAAVAEVLPVDCGCGRHSGKGWFGWHVRLTYYRPYKQTSLIQASQTNIQSTLLVVASQGQQMSAQINSLEQMVFRRMDDFEERMSQRFEQLEKRQGEDEVQPAIKRRRLHQESATELPDDKFVTKGTVSAANSTDSGRANATGGWRCTLPGPISLSSQDPSLTSLEEVKGQELHSEPLAGPHMAPRGSLSKRSQSTLPLKESSRSKAQKLASFFGDSETPEDGNMDDLFSRFEHA